MNGRELRVLLGRGFGKVRGTVAVMREIVVGVAVNGKDLCFHIGIGRSMCHNIGGFWLADVGWLLIMAFFWNVGFKSSR